MLSEIQEKDSNSLVPVHLRRRVTKIVVVEAFPISISYVTPTPHTLQSTDSITQRDCFLPNY